MPETIRPARVDTNLLDLGDRRIHRPQQLAVSRSGMVVTAHEEATRAGVEMLEDKGNAMDAAVAAAFALGVCEPAASGLGGQTMMLVHVARQRKTFALDGSSRAPNRATADALRKEDRRYGYRATTVPSTPAALRYLLERYGKLKLARVLEPAIRLAEEGYPVSPLQHALQMREHKNLRAGNAAKLFLQKGTRAYATGTLFRQPVLANTLRRMAKKGVRDFYSGEIAKQIDRDMRRNDGLVRLDDLAQVPRPIERRPITTKWSGSRLFTFPLPGAGRALIEMLNIYGSLPVALRDFDTPRGSAALAELIRRALLDRHDRPYDPNFFQQVANKRMLSEESARLVAGQIRKTLAGTGETTHLSVLDKAGNAVALTQSIERVYGACVATPELGFLYNNYMSSFEYKVMSHPYYLRPNACPWSSVAPTILRRGPRAWLVIGSPGSERITSTLLQVLVRLERLPPFAAVDAPRLHCSLNGVVALEAARMRDDIPTALSSAGFEVDVRDPYSFYLGCVALALRDGDEFIGVADPRRDGAAKGPAA